MTIEEMLEDVEQAAERHGRYDEACHHAKGTALYLLRNIEREAYREWQSARQSLLKRIRELAPDQVREDEIELDYKPISSTRVSGKLKPDTGGGDDESG